MNIRPHVMSNLMLNLRRLRRIKPTVASDDGAHHAEKCKSLTVDVSVPSNGNSDAKKQKSLIEANHNSGTKKRKSLIADFAQRRDSYDPKAKRSVQFSKVKHVHVYEPHNEDEVDADELFYSKADLALMVDTRIRDVRRARFCAKVRPGGDISQSKGLLDGDAFTGIENFVDQDILETAVRCREGCLRAVLREQARQRVAGQFDPHMMAKVSKIQSMWATKRAEMIGCHQSR